MLQGQLLSSLRPAEAAALAPPLLLLSAFTLPPAFALALLPPYVLAEAEDPLLLLLSSLLEEDSELSELLPEDEADEDPDADEPDDDSLGEEPKPWPWGRHCHQVLS